MDNKTGRILLKERLLKRLVNDEGIKIWENPYLFTAEQQLRLINTFCSIGGVFRNTFAQPFEEAFSYFYRFYEKMEKRYVYILIDKDGNEIGRNKNYEKVYLARLGRQNNEHIECVTEAYLLKPDGTREWTEFCRVMML